MVRTADVAATGTVGDSHPLKDMLGPGHPEWCCVDLALLVPSRFQSYSYRSPPWGRPGYEPHPGRECDRPTGQDVEHATNFQFRARLRASLSNSSDICRAFPL